MKSEKDCVFCKIVAGEVPSHMVWEDETHCAFLSIYPNTEGVTVVIPKEHHPSYVFEAPETVANDLIRRSEGRSYSRYEAR